MQLRALGRSTSHRSGPTTADPSSFPAIPPSDEKNEIENEAIDDNVDLQEVISKGSLDFDKWTLLISEIEKGGSMLRLEYKNTSVTVWDVGGQDKVSTSSDCAFRIGMEQMRYESF
ncbi:hypothetical protein JHK86_042981 [Glycine max]|nr:hypothetical protein JHK86_042981 [Glycine max]